MTTVLSHPIAVSCRNSLRKNAWLKRVYVRWILSRDYEERFSRALVDEIRPGDTVWDVGANVGLYAARFLERRAARVVCFEPAPDALRKLQSRFEAELGERGRVRIAPVALGSTHGTVRFEAAGDSPTNRIAEGGSDGGVEVAIRRGDQARAELGLPLPNVIKIDVEGYEPDVLEGLPETLRSPQLRAVFVEVHFSLLHGRGLDDAPARMVALLRRHGFKVDWLDLSHFSARR